MSDPTKYGSIRVHGLTLEKLARLIADEDLQVSGPFTVDGDVSFGGSLDHEGPLIGFFGVGPVTQRNVTQPGVGTLSSTFVTALADVSGTGDDSTVNANVRLLYNWLLDLTEKLTEYGFVAASETLTPTASDGATASDSATSSGGLDAPTIGEPIWEGDT